MFNGLRRFILPLAFIYIISPLDLMPLFPADDLLVLAVAIMTYFGTASSNGMRHQRENAAPVDEDDDVITTSWSVIEEE